MRKKYTKKLVDSGYDILVKEKIRWPKSFTPEMKQDLYTKMIEFYTKNQEFERCDELSQSMINIEKE